MREFKIRVWDVKDNDWYYTVPGRPEDHNVLDTWYFENLYQDENTYIWEQYTGLKDKNGREIYEGDIVEQFVCGVKKFKGKEVGRKTVWQVRWNEEECCFELHYLSGSLFGDSLMVKGEEYEVVGNIHENPELLKGEE